MTAEEAVLLQAMIKNLLAANKQLGKDMDQLTGFCNSLKQRIENLEKPKSKLLRVN